jgi:cysteine desulfurase
MAKSIQANEKEVIFTSGGTEADNLALIGTAIKNRHKGNHIITSAQEHHATLHTIQSLGKQGFDVTYLPVYSDGKISLNDLAKSITEDTVLVSIMFVNNETGVVQPVEEIGEMLKEHQAYFHTDAVQAYGLIDIDVKEMGIDMLSASSHKINGPKGIGFLYASEDVNLHAIQYGGEQERKRRPGTENVVAAVGFQKAVELAIEKKAERRELYQSYKEQFFQELKENNIAFSINGDYHDTVPSIINISFPGTNVEALLSNFDLDGVAASSGSACTAGSIEPSHVLSAMYGKNHECTTNSIRFSFGLANTSENVKHAAVKVAKAVKRLTS